MKDFLGFGIPDVYGNILKDPQKQALESQALKRGTTIGLLNFLTQPRNQNYGSILPYIGQAVGSGLQTYQGGLDAGLATALKAKALETDDTPKFGTIDPSKYTPESVAKFEMTKKASDLRRITDPTTTKGMTDEDILKLETAFPGFKTDEQTKALLRTDRTKGLELFNKKYTEANVTEQPKYTQASDRMAKTMFGGKINSETGEKYPDNAVFGDLSPTDANAVSKQSRAQELEDKIKEFQAQSDATVGSQEYILKTADAMRKEYNQQVKDAGFLDARDAFKRIETAIESGTAIGDVASATSIMKLLDPGSVVRESELGIALKARGVVDGFMNFKQQTFEGKRLTEQQRKDFDALAREFYKVAQETKAEIDQRYLTLGQNYNIPPELLGVRSGGGQKMRRYNPITKRIE